MRKTRKQWPSPKMASGGLLDGPWGAPAPEARAQRHLLDFKLFWASPPLGASFGAPRGVLGCLWGGFGGDRAGTLINRRFGVFLLPFVDSFGVVFLMFFRCLLGASPALFVVLVSARFLCRCSSCRCTWRKWPTRVAYRKNQWNLMILRSCSRRPRCDQEAWHDAKTSSKNGFLESRNRSMFFDVSCPRGLENGAFGG